MLVSGPVKSCPQHFHLGHQLCQLEVDVLVVKQRLPEGLPLLEILDGLSYDVVHGLHAEGGAGQPLLLELKHLISEAHARLPNDVLGGDPDVVQVNDGCVGAPHPHLVYPLVKVDTRSGHGETDQGLVAVN